MKLVEPLHFLFRAEYLPRMAFLLRQQDGLLRGVFLRGSGWGSLYIETGVLLLMGIFLLTVASKRFKRKIG